MAKILPRIKYSETARCACGGDYSYDASMMVRLPMGFGFVGSRFQIDVVTSRGWRGECMDCQKQVFAVTSDRHSTKFPKLCKKGAR